MTSLWCWSCAACSNSLSCRDESKCQVPLCNHDDARVDSHSVCKGELQCQVSPVRAKSKRSVFFRDDVPEVISVQRQDNLARHGRVRPACWVAVQSTGGRSGQASLECERSDSGGAARSPKGSGENCRDAGSSTLTSANEHWERQNVV